MTAPSQAARDLAERIERLDELGRRGLAELIQSALDDYAAKELSDIHTKDRARLDWLDSQKRLTGVDATVGGWAFRYLGQKPIFTNGNTDLRTAIDQAMTHEKAP